MQYTLKTKAVAIFCKIWRCNQFQLELRGRHEISHRCAKSSRDLRQRHDCYVVVSPFDSPKVADIDLCKVRQLFLR